jgi:hypothetical protein
MHSVEVHVLCCRTCLQILLAAAVHVVMLYIGAAVAKSASDILYLVSDTLATLVFVVYGSVHRVLQVNCDYTV